MRNETVESLIKSSPALDVTRFLIIEDDESMKVMWEFILKKIPFNCQVDWASSAAEGESKMLKANKHFSYDMIICDYFLEGSVTGLDLWKRKSFGESKFLIVSAITTSEFKEYSKGLEEVPLFIEKRIGPCSLGHRIAELLSKDWEPEDINIH